MRVIGALLALLLLGACGGGDEPARPTPPAPASTPPSAPAPEPPPAAPEEPASAPEGNLRGDAANGAELYALYCSSCHGKTGKGDGPVAAAFPTRPADHSDAAYMGKLSDAHIYKVIQKGGASVGKSPLMAPWGGILSDPQLRDLVAYVRQLSGT